MPKSATARAAARNSRRVRRHGVKAWMRGQPMMKSGMGGTDKNGTVKPSPVYYSDASAEIRRGHPNRWPGLEFRPK